MADAAETILKKYHYIAIVGASPEPDKDSNHVTGYLIDAGYKITPVNPTTKTVLGLKSYPSLSEMPKPVEVVDVFRNPAFVMPIVNEAIGVGAKALWLQEGVINREAAAKARAAGLLVVMDRCIAKEHQRLLASGRLAPLPG